MVHRSDPQLIQACRSGDQHAWNELVDLYGRLVYSIPRRYGLSDTDADEVFQNAFASLFQHLDSIRDDTRISAWLITTAHRECWRVGKRSDSYEDLDQRIKDLGSPSDEQIATWERHHLVRQGLGQMDGRCRDLLTALFLQPVEGGYEAIAEQLGMKVGSIGPTRARCFQKLEKILLDLGVQA